MRRIVIIITHIFLGMIWIKTNFLTIGYADEFKDIISAFNPQWLTPYLSNGIAEEARIALQSNDFKKAVTLIRDYLKHEHQQEQQQSSFLLAYALYMDKNYSEALEIFNKLTNEYPLLMDYHLLYRARCYYHLQQFNQALMLIQKTDPQFALKLEADLLRAEIYRKTDRHEDALPIWYGYAEQYPQGRRITEINFYIGETVFLRAQKQLLLNKNKRTNHMSTDIKNALIYFKKVLIQIPSTEHRQAIEKYISLINKNIADGTKYSQLSIYDRFSQATSYAMAMLHKTAEKKLRTLQKEKNLPSDLKCKINYYLAKSIYLQRQRAQAIPFYLKAINVCKMVNNRELWVNSLFGSAKSYMQTNQYIEAIEKCNTIETEFKNDSLADDARVIAAKAYKELGNKDKAMEYFSSIHEKYPSGDMGSYALWQIAFQAYNDKNYTLSNTYLNEMILRYRNTMPFYSRGKGLYWKARIADEQGDQKAARGFYQSCIEQYPLSYYSLMAFNRLREKYKFVFNQLYQKFIRPCHQNNDRWNFYGQWVFNRPEFKRGLEFTRLGLAKEAEQEFAMIGLDMEKSLSLNDFWLISVLLDHAGIWEKSQRIPERFANIYQYSFPLDTNYRYWEIAYPRAYNSLVNKYSRLLNLQQPLIWSVMRAESAFSPKVTSWANAIGLMQLIMPTAQRTGKVYNMNVTRTQLQNPSVNIRLGTTYLAYLHNNYEQRLPLTIAAYNAGEGAVLKWIKQNNNIKTDEFIENIPYNETQRYTQRVLSNLFTYAVLYNNGLKRIPSIEQELPHIIKLKPLNKDLINKK